MNFLNKVKKATDGLKFLDPLRTRLALCIALVIYMVFIVHYLPMNILEFLQSGIMRLVILLLILMILCRAPDVALFLSLAYLVTMQAYGNRVMEGLEMPKNVEGKEILPKKDGTYEIKMTDNKLVSGKYDADKQTMELTVLEGDKKGMKLVGKLDNKGRLVVNIDEKKHYVDEKGKLAPMVEGFADHSDLEIVSKNADGTFICKTKDEKLVEVSKEAAKYVNMKEKKEDAKAVFEKARSEGLFPQYFEFLGQVHEEGDDKLMQFKHGEQLGFVVLHVKEPMRSMYFYGDLSLLAKIGKEMKMNENEVKNTPDNALNFLANEKQIPKDAKVKMTKVDENGMETTFDSSKGQGKFKVDTKKEITVLESPQNTEEKREEKREEKHEEKKSDDMVQTVVDKLKEGQHIPADAAVKSAKKIEGEEYKVQVVYCSGEKNGAFVIDFENMDDVKVNMGEYDVADMCKTTENFSMPVDFNAGLVDGGNFNYTSGCTGDCKFGLPLTGGPLDGPCNAVSTFNPSLNAQGINCPSGYDGPQIGALVE